MDEEREPELEERQERQERQEEAEEQQEQEVSQAQERPTDFTLGAMLASVQTEQRRLEERQNGLEEALLGLANRIPAQVAEAAEDAVEDALEEAEEPNEAQVQGTQPSGLKWWERALMGGRSH